MGAYHTEPAGLDGYAAGTGACSGPRHTADYRSSFWQIDGSEISRVLSYWRAGGYHPSAAGYDGYAPGRGTEQVLARPAGARQTNNDSQSALRVEQSGPLIYAPGGIVQITNTIHYDQPLLSLLCRPKVPDSWTLHAVSGDGNPEAVSGELVWTASIPPSPIHLVHSVQVPAADRSTRQVRTEVEYQFAAMVNPASRYGDPDPLALGTVRILGTVLRDGAICCNLLGEAGRSYLIQSSTNLVNWVDVMTVAVSDGPQPLTQMVTVDQSFYRAVLVP